MNKCTLNWTFSAGPANQSLYRWQKKSGLEKLPGSYKTCNSMSFDYKRNILYSMDGCEQTVTAFKINKKTGKICKWLKNCTLLNSNQSNSYAIQWYFLANPWIVISNFGVPNSVAPVGITVDKVNKTQSKLFVQLNLLD